MSDNDLLTEFRVLRAESRALMGQMAEAMDTALVLLEAGDVAAASKLLREHIEVCRGRPLGTAVN